MVQGVLIAESLRTGTCLSDVSLVVNKFSRWEIPETGPGQPSVWTIIEFKADDVDPEPFAQRLADLLDPCAWYVDFSSERDKYVVFPGKVFHYRRGDAVGRGEAAQYARSLGIPDSQLDWAE